MNPKKTTRTKKAESKQRPRKKTVKVPKASPPLAASEVKEVKAIVEVLPSDLRRADELMVESDFPWTLEVAEGALHHIDPGVGRAEWRKVVTGLMTQFQKTAEVKKLVERWSAGDLHGGKKPDNYNAVENERQWDSFSPGHVTIGRLYQLAVEGGWDPLTWRKKQAEDDGAILTGMDDSRTIASQVWEQIMEGEKEHQSLFRYGRQIARMDEEIEVLTEDAFWQVLGTRLTFCRMATRRVVRCDPPASLIRYILNTPAKDVPLPELMGVTRTPVIAPDGSIHIKAGYSPVSKRYHVPSVNPTNPGQSDA